jgi:hypothetical protein
MASGAFVFFDKAILNIANATNLLSSANTFKMTLHTSSWTPSLSADEVYADVDNELTTANGYTNGGITLANDALTESSGVTKFTFDAAVWTATGGSIAAWRYAIVRASGTLNGKVDPLVGYFIGDSTPADIPATTVGNTLTITPHASGVLTMDQA